MARTSKTAVPAIGAFVLEMWGVEAKPISSWTPYFVEATDESVVVEACSPDGELDWHFLGVWRGLGVVPADVRLDEPGSPHFEGEIKGIASELGSDVNAIFETVAVPAVAASGKGTVTAYVAGGVFAGHLDVHVFESSESTNEAAGATVDFDLTF